MSAIAVEANNDSPIVQPVFTGTARWLVAIVLITGPLLQVIEFLLETGSDDNAARVSFWTAHPGQVGLSMDSGLLAVPFLLGGSATLVALTRARSRRLSWLGGAFMAFGLVGLGAVHGYEVAAYGLAQVGNQATATAVLNADHLGLPGGVLLAIFLGGAVLGTLALAIAAWRSPLVPRIVVLFMLAFAVLDFAVGQGVVSHLVNFIGFTILAVAVIAGYSRRI